MTERAISHARALELFSYDPLTGLLTRRVTVNYRAQAGSEPGWKMGRYRAVTVDGQFVLVHRLIWFMVHGVWPDGVVDHWDHDGHNNRLANLRDVSSQVNSQNTKAVKVGKKYGTLAGANWDASTSNWKSSICVDGKHKHLGRYPTEQEAHDVHVAAKRRLHEGCTI